MSESAQTQMSGAGGRDKLADSLRKAIGVTGSALAVGAVLSAVGSLTVGLVAGAHIFGDYVVLTTMIQFVSLFGRLGSERFVVSERARSVDEGALVAANLLTIATLSGIVMGVVGAALASTVFAKSLSASPRLHTLALIALAILLESIRPVATECLRAAHEFRRAAMVNSILKPLGFAVCLMGSSALGLSINVGPIMMSVVAGSAIANSIALLHLLRRERLPRPAIFSWLRTHGRNHASVTLASAAALLLNVGDLWIVGSMGDDGDRGSYAAALTMVSLLALTSTAIASSSHPFLASKHSAGEERFNRSALRATQRLTLRATAAATGVLLVVVLLIFLLRTQLDSSGYRNLHLYTAILGFGQLAAIAGGPSGHIFTLLGSYSTLLRVVVPVAILTLSLEALASNYTQSALVIAIISSCSLVSLHGINNAVLYKRYGFMTVLGPRTRS